MDNHKFYNQSGEEGKERPDGWAIDTSRGTPEELDMLIKLLTQFNPIKLNKPTDVSQLKNIDYGTK